FDPASLAVFRNIAPNVMRGIVSERFRDKDYWSNLSAWRRFTLRHMLHAAATAPHFIAYDTNGLPSAAPLLARYLFGVPLLTWTVRTPSQRRRARLFADAMIFEGFRP
ncbi:MAG TPA: glycerophosphodiester phosphodiesterase, partial [Hyphomicrobiales bacterium]|nr:glycerophosphodiester phosphodiesterase [Hyphomicrobiales bacterium]